MKISSESNEAFNVNIVGQLNPAIFSPTWVKTNVASAPDAEVTMAYAIGLLASPPRLTVEKTNIYPSPYSLMFDCVDLDDSAIEDCAVKVEKIAKALPHTPVQGVGVNIRYYGTLEESAEFIALFTFSDAGGIDARTYEPASATVKRSFHLQGDDVLNFSIEHTLDGTIRCEFNFHTSSVSMATIAEKASADRLKQLRIQAAEFMREVYNVEIN